jgi:hypothetical protein
MPYSQAELGVITMPSPPILSASNNSNKKGDEAVNSATTSAGLRADTVRKKQEERELGKFSDEIKTLSLSELERDRAEMSYEIELLEIQLRAGLREYSPRDLELGYAKVTLFKRKVELMNLEIDRREREKD